MLYQLFNRIFYGLLAICAVAILIFVVLSGSAYPHSFYETQCCSDKDCAPVSKIENHPDGDLMTSEHGTVLVTKNIDSWKRRKSQDDKYHVCMRTASGSEPQYNGKHLICVYYPALF